MSKILTMRFTGTIVLTPEYPDDLTTSIPGPLTAIIPGGRRRRTSEYPGQQVDAQFAFVLFQYAHLDRSKGGRLPDFTFPGETNPQIGVAFLEKEHMTIDPPPQNNVLTFVDGDNQMFPTTATRATSYIARWSRFADTNASLDNTALKNAIDYVSVLVPGGEVASGYAGEPIAQFDFDYSLSKTPDDGKPKPYAQQVVVTMTFPDTTPYISLVSTASDGGTSTFDFTWGGRPQIDLLFGNGALSSLLNVLNSPDAPVFGRDHMYDYDVDFEVLYDIIKCDRDGNNHRPVPHIKSLEILRVPCAASMIPPPKGGTKIPTTPLGRFQIPPPPPSSTRSLPTRSAPVTLPTSGQEPSAGPTKPKKPAKKAKAPAASSKQAATAKPAPRKGTK